MRKSYSVSLLCLLLVAAIVGMVWFWTDGDRAASVRAGSVQLDAGEVMMLKARRHLLPQRFPPLLRLSSVSAMCIGAILMLTA